MTDKQIVALTGDDETYYLVPREPFPTKTWRGDITWAARDGDPLEPTNARRDPYGASRWLKHPGPPRDLIATRPTTPTLTGYRLADPAAESAKFPATLTIEEFKARTAGFDDTADSPEGALYERVTEPQPDQHMLIPATSMLIIDDATPAPDDGHRWVANLRDELKRHPEVHHLFPGHLVGFRAAFIEAVKALPFMDVRQFIGGDSAREDRDRRGYVDITRYAAYEPHHTRFVRDTGSGGRKLQSGRTVTETKMLTVSLPVPDTIAGTTRAEATIIWEATMSRLLAEVTDALTPAPCWHCRGTGVVTQAELANATKETA